MKATLFLYGRVAASFALCVLTFSCATSTQDQFGGAVARGNVAAAAAYNGPNYANMRIWKSPTQYAVPMQYAIIQNNKPMAGFLLQNGAQRQLNGQNLAYYSAVNGRPEMANFFVSRGIGDSSDVGRGLATRAVGRRADRQNAQMAGLIGLGILAVMAGSAGGGSSNDEIKQQADAFEIEQRNREQRAAQGNPW